MMRPKRRESFEMVQIKQAGLSTDKPAPEKPVRYTQVTREPALEEEDDIYNVPSLNKPAAVEGDDIYFAPSLQKKQEPVVPGPPSRPVPQLPGPPSRPPPSRPPPSLPPRTDQPGDEYVVQDPDEKLVTHGEYLVTEGRVYITLLCDVLNVFCCVLV